MHGTINTMEAARRLLRMAERVQDEEGLGALIPDEFDKRRKNPETHGLDGENPDAYGADSHNPIDATLSVSVWSDMQSNPEWMRIMQAPYRARKSVGDPETNFRGLYCSKYPEAKHIWQSIPQEKCFDPSAQQEIESIMYSLDPRRACWRQINPLDLRLQTSPHTHAFLFTFGSNYMCDISPGEYAFCKVKITAAQWREVDCFCCADNQELSQMLSNCQFVVRDFNRKLARISSSSVNARLKAANATTGMAFKPGMFCMVFVGPNDDDSSIHMYFTSFEDLEDNFQQRLNEADTTQRQAREDRLHPAAAQLRDFPPLSAVDSSRPAARGRGRNHRSRYAAPAAD